MLSRFLFSAGSKFVVDMAFTILWRHVGHHFDGGILKSYSQHLRLCWLNLAADMTWQALLKIETSRSF
jgi:hypothetical protein